MSTVSPIVEQENKELLIHLYAVAAAQIGLVLTANHPKALLRRIERICARSDDPVISALRAVPSPVVETEVWVLPRATIQEVRQQKTENET